MHYPEHVTSIQSHDAAENPGEDEGVRMKDEGHNRRLVEDSNLGKQQFKWLIQSKQVPGFGDRPWRRPTADRASPRRHGAARTGPRDPVTLVEEEVVVHVEAGPPRLNHAVP